jgi:hypothetical protein
MAENFTIKIEGVEELQRKAAKFPGEVKKNMRQAASEAIKKVLLPVVGLQKYPPATSANYPPEPYYIRGRGTQTKRGNTGKSERLGTQWYTKPAGAYGTEVGNRASYARWVHGEEQANAMQKIGWRRLVDVAKEKTPEIIKIFDKWIAYTIRKLGL